MTAATHKPELLAPAGSLQTGLIAIDAGADAIYAGLPRFNARERGQNCSMEELARLAATGISSLKIEGRLRRSDYVRNVVEAYRLMLDTPEQDRAATLPEAKRILAQALGRETMRPFHTEADFKQAIQHRTVGTSGQRIGTVTQNKAHGFIANLSGVLHRHDTIRVQPTSGDDGLGLAVTRIIVNNNDGNGALSRFPQTPSVRPMPRG